MQTYQIRRQLDDKISFFVFFTKTLSFILQSGTNGRSRYDTLAAIHTAAVDEVHFGPSFSPWHRLYLIL